MQIQRQAVILFTILSFLTIIISCHRGFSNLDRIRISFRMPLGIDKGKGVIDKTDLFVSNYKYYTLYELPYHETLSEGIWGEKVDLIFDSVKYNYFICDKRKDIGYFLKKFSTDSFTNIVNKDSILKGRAFSGGGEMLTLKNINTIKIDTLPNGSNFIIRHIVNDSYYDSLYLYFDKEIRDVQFCISKSLDSSYQAKLYKFEMFLKSDSLRKANPHLKDFFINSIELRKERSKDEQSLINLFKRFEEFDKNKK
jgi:hypothetical protein